MFLYLLMQIVLIAGGFTAWYFMPGFFSIGYCIFYLIPILCGALGITIRTKINVSSGFAIFLIIFIPFSIWLAGAWYIYEAEKF